MGKLRGNILEMLINNTNCKYNNNNIAIVQKIATPIKILDVKQGKITGFLESKSTVDYIGVYKGLPFCFDAKETAQTNLPLKNIHQHQIEFMEKYELQGGLAFLLVNFVKKDEIYFLPFIEFKKFLIDANQGARKSIPYEYFDRNGLVKNENGFIVNYIKFIKTN